MHQYLFFLGDFPIRAYGLVLSLSIILATGVGYFLAKADGRGYEKYIVDLGIYCGVAGLVGARLWDVFFFDWAYYHNHLTELLNVWQGGMAIQGGVLLGVLTGIWYCRRHGLDTLHLMDVLYPTTTLAYHTYGDQPLWPAEIWEGQLDTAIFALLLLYRTTGHARGQCFALYVMLYSTARFFLEFFRGDYTAPVLGLLHSAQMTSVVCFALAAAAFLYLQSRRRGKEARIFRKGTKKS
jgi:phosphatidylglycerol:prolipoprotein diacylglycerol transferase